MIPDLDAIRRLAEAAIAYAVEDAEPLARHVLALLSLLAEERGKVEAAEERLVQIYELAAADARAALPKEPS